MFRWLFKVVLVTLVVSCAWNLTRVSSCALHVRDAWIRSQRQQTLADWEIHAQHELGKLERCVDELESLARQELIAAEVAHQREERLVVRQQRAEESLLKLQQQPEAANEATRVAELSLSRASANAARLERELEDLARQLEGIRTQREQHAAVAQRYFASAEQLRARFVELRDRVRELAQRRALVAAERRAAAVTRTCASQCAIGQREIEAVDSLCKLLEDELDRWHATQQVGVELGTAHESLDTSSVQASLIRRR